MIWCFILEAQLTPLMSSSRHSHVYPQVHHSPPVLLGTRSSGIMPFTHSDKWEQEECTSVFVAGELLAHDRVHISQAIVMRVFGSFIVTGFRHQPSMARPLSFSLCCVCYSGVSGFLRIPFLLSVKWVYKQPFFFSRYASTLEICWKNSSKPWLASFVIFLLDPQGDQAELGTQ